MFGTLRSSVAEAAHCTLESIPRKAQHQLTLWPTEVVVMAAPSPSIGEWYRHTGGDSFEVVAFDEDDGTIEIQYFDGTVEEMDTEDWDSQWADRALEKAEPPEDWTGSVDVESTDDSATGSDISGDESTLRASSLDGIDLFE